MSKGKFIVIDGTDGSGKATQVEILKNRLEKEGREVMIVDFPRYDKPSGIFCTKYLNGEYGQLKDISPEQGSLFYAMDRFDAKKEMIDHLSRGKILLANRYVSASMGHQGSKIADLVERKNFLDWVEDLEYSILGIPRPDATLILHVPAEINQELVDKKDPRDYVNGKKRDLHESDLNHLKSAEATYLQIARDYPNFHLIECVKDGRLMSREDIHELIWAKVKDLL